MNNKTLVGLVTRLIKFSIDIYNSNVSHGFQDFHHSVQSSHDFVDGIVGTLPSSNHDGVPSDGTIGYGHLKPVDGKRNPLVHEVAQVRGLTSQFHHHTQL